MPLYEYACESCAARTEVIQKVGAPPLSTCPQCGGPLQKVLAPPALQFKGSGWYVTDYARAGRGSKNEVHVDSPAKAENKSASKSEPASSTATKP